MRIYADSSALIKRAVEEAESDALEAALEQQAADGAAIVASSLARVEVSRAVRTLSGTGRHRDESLAEAIDVALSGVAERPLTDEVVSLARRVGPPVLRTLDAIHLASGAVRNMTGFEQRTSV
ncbi:MAG: type II toxin-antitoxin system VapC family toxin [Acidimicrobiia bacterium]|nr:type II toxin-antitoxin system VapC family toxin [Acidimicrobiia bacterium]